MKIIIAITLAVIAAAVGYLARAEHDRRRAAEELAERLRHAAFLADLRELCFYPGSTVERPDAEDVCYAYRTAAGIPHPPPPPPPPPSPEQ